MARKRPVDGAVVRAWAKSDEGAAALAAADLKVGDRGRFGKPVLDLFHAANPGTRYTVGHVEPVVVKGVRTTDSGRKVPVSLKVSPADLRAFAVETTGARRGRIGAETLAAFAARPKV